MAGNTDDTVLLVPRRGRRWRWIAPGLACLLAVAAGLAWLYWPTTPDEMATADEAQIVAETPATLTALRFRPNPAILVLDFPSLAEQGRMLNRVAALVEKAGQPHDRLLDDAALDAAIQASGTTAATYYYGHDYRVTDIARFFALAGRDHVALNADEQHLQRVLGQAPDVGAVITLPRADAANDVDQDARGAILHHELSHGEYFTNAGYARYVGTVWRGVLTGEERVRFTAYLATEGYDPALEDLSINEMQAYLMFTPDPRFFDPARVGFSAARLAEIRTAFAAGMPAGWLRQAMAPAVAAQTPR